MEPNGSRAFRVNKINFKLSMLSRLVFLFILLAKYIGLDISEPDAMTASAIHP
jgi:hypothetical protein